MVYILNLKNGVYFTTKKIDELLFKIKFIKNVILILFKKYYQILFLIVTEMYILFILKKF